MIQAVVAAQQAVLNPGCERDSVIGIHVLRRINEIGHDGEPAGFSETVRRDVVEARLDIEEMHFFLVSGAGGPCFHLHRAFLFVVAVFIKPDGFTPPQILWRRWAVVGNTDVDVAATAVGFDSQISQRFSDVHVVVIRIVISAREGIPTDFLIGHGDALLEFGHVVERGRWVGDVGVQFDVELLNIGVQHHREPHDAFGGPGPCFVDEAELAKRFRVVIPLVGNFVRLCVEGVFCHLLEVVKFE